MELSEIIHKSIQNQEKTKQILKESKFIEILESNGLRVNLIGSLRMGLMVNHLDIDLHIYDKDITVESSFQIISKLTTNPKVIETLSINRLNTDEHCIEWHMKYRDYENEIWQIDIIHIEERTQYDGYFERMDDRICEGLIPSKRNVNLKLKYLTSDDNEIQIHSAEIYEAVIDKGIEDFEELKGWVRKRRLEESYLWAPKE